jgi:hypothetical protein
MPVTLYLKTSGHPALRLCDPLSPCPVLGGYDPALMDWSGVAPNLFDNTDQDTFSLGFDNWVDDANVWQEIVTVPADSPRQPGASWPAPSGWYERPKKKPIQDEIEEAAEQVAELVSHENYRVTPQQIARIATALVKRTELPVVDLFDIRQQVDELQARVQEAIAANMQRKGIERRAADVVALLAYLIDLQSKEEDDFLLLMAA